MLQIEISLQGAKAAEILLISTHTKNSGIYALGRINARGGTRNPEGKKLS